MKKFLKKIPGEIHVVIFSLAGSICIILWHLTYETTESYTTPSDNIEHNFLFRGDIVLEGDITVETSYCVNYMMGNRRTVKYDKQENIFGSIRYIELLED